MQRASDCSRSSGALRGDAIRGGRTRVCKRERRTASPCNLQPVRSPCPSRLSSRARCSRWSPQSASCSSIRRRRAAARVHRRRRTCHSNGRASPGRPDPHRGTCDVDDERERRSLCAHRRARRPARPRDAARASRIGYSHARRARRARGRHRPRGHRARAVDDRCSKRGGRPANAAASDAESTARERREAGAK